jgi:hypothetical protein
MFEIKGFIEVRCEGETYSIRLRPDSAWLSPDKKYAVAYDYDAVDKSKQCKCLLLENESDNQLNFKVSNTAVWFQHLLVVALAQKPVKLILNDGGETINGFIFPA